MQTKTLLIAVSLACAAACQPAPVEKAPEPPAVIEAPATPEPASAAEVTVPPLSEADYQMLPLGDLQLTGTESAEGIATQMQAQFGTKEATEGNYKEYAIVNEDGANATIAFIMSGLADDSIRGKQYVAEVFLPAATASGVTGFGVRYQCYRAPDPEAWTKGPCP